MPSSTGVTGTLLDQAPDGVLLVDVTGARIVDVNATFCELSGWPRDELLGRSVETLLDADDLVATPLAPGRARDGRIAVAERRLVRPDGSRVWCQTATRQTDQGYLVFVRDIADLMRDRQQLQQLMRVAHLRTELTAVLLAPDVSLPVVLDRAAAGLVRSIGDLCVIALVDMPRGLLVPTAFHHRDPLGEQIMQATLTTRPMELGTGTAGKVAVDGVPIRLADMPLDAYRESVPAQYRPYVDRYPISSMMVVPLLGQQGVIGTLGVARGPAYSDEDEQIVVDLADVIALAIEDVRNDVRLRRANFLLQTVTNALPAMVSYWNPELRCEFANDAYREWFGLTSEDMQQRHAREVLGDEAFERYEPFIAGVLAGERQDYDRAMRDASGRFRHVQVTYIPDVRPAGHVAGFVSLATDVTPWTQAAAKFEYQALHDPLTGLRNRRSLLDHISLALATLRREDGVIALFFVDLDDFKQINDREGHHVGDLVLTATADRIRRVIRPGDTAARLGGDEFVVLCHVSDLSQAADIHRRLRAALSEPTSLGGDRRLDVSASIGMACGDNADATSPEGLLAAADAAMFRSKRGEAGADGAQSPTKPREAAPD